MPFAYVSNYSSRSISVIDIVSNTVVDTFEINGAGNPWGVCLTPDKQILFLTMYSSGDVLVLLATGLNAGRQLGITRVGDYATGVTVTPDGKHAYVAGYNVLSEGGDEGFLGSITQIDTTTFIAQQVIGTPPVGPGPEPGQGTILHRPYGLAAYNGPIGQRVYIADLGWTYGTPSGGLTVVSDAHPDWGPMVPEMAPNPFNFFYSTDLAVAPSGMVYVANNSWVYPFPPNLLLGEGPSTITAAREGRIPPPQTGILAGGPESGQISGLAASSSGRRIYVAHWQGGYISVIGGESGYQVIGIVMRAFSSQLAWRSRPMSSPST